MPYRLAIPQCCVALVFYMIFLYMGWVMGFEPTSAGATILCLNHLTTPTTVFFNGDPDRARTDDLQRDRLAF